MNTAPVVTVFETPSPNYNTSPLTFTVPNSTVILPKPFSYDFRVVEMVDDSGNILKVGLQGKIYEHDQFGNPIVIQDWIDIPRVKINVATGKEL